MEHLQIIYFEISVFVMCGDLSSPPKFNLSLKEIEGLLSLHMIKGVITCPVSSRAEISPIGLLHRRFERAQYKFFVLDFIYEAISKCQQSHCPWQFRFT